MGFRESVEYLTDVLGKLITLDEGRVYAERVRFAVAEVPYGTTGKLDATSARKRLRISRLFEGPLEIRVAHGGYSVKTPDSMRKSFTYGEALFCAHEWELVTKNPNIEDDVSPFLRVPVNNATRFAEARIYAPRDVQAQTHQEKK